MAVRLSTFAKDVAGSANDRDLTPAQAAGFRAAMPSMPRGNRSHGLGTHKYGTKAPAPVVEDHVETEPEVAA